MNSPTLPELYGECIRSSTRHPACEEFFRIVLPILKRISFRVARQFDALGEVDDLVQEVSLKLIASGTSILQSLPEDPSATLAYFSVLAANSARDFFRTRRAFKRGAQATFSMEAQLTVVAASLRVAQDYDRELLLNGIEENLPDDRRERVVFRLYYRQGLTAKEISSIPTLNLTVKGVESMIFRITRGIRTKFQEGRHPRIGEGFSRKAT